ncbi:MAG: hypothetical protein JOZ17_02770 [Acetobacteraceae bacterium]|nr:hypothetical protein [Acetobacteraceae bacterium]
MTRRVSVERRPRARTPISYADLLSLAAIYDGTSQAEAAEPVNKLAENSTFAST